MRALLAFAFLMLLVSPALAGERDSQHPPDLSRACPRGFSVVNGKCTPPCEQGTRRNLAGRCVAQSCPQGQEMAGGKCVATGNADTPQCGPDETLAGGNCVNTGDCPDGQERVGNDCKAKCLPKQARDAEGICVIQCAEGQVRTGSFCHKPGLGTGFNN